MPNFGIEILYRPFGPFDQNTFETKKATEIKTFGVSEAGLKNGEESQILRGPSMKKIRLLSNVLAKDR